MSRLSLPLLPHLARYQYIDCRMQRPPSLPPILTTRPLYEWIARVDQRAREFDRLAPGPAKMDAIKEWLTRSFARSILLVSAADSAKEEDRLSAALDIVIHLESVIDKHGAASRLTPELIRRLHIRGEASELRTHASTTSKVSPARPEMLPALLDTACQWFEADSFTELHPIEQASISHLRLVELQPFDDWNEGAALLAASLFTLRAELPPVIIAKDRLESYQNALVEGQQMNTRPMVETIANAVERTLSEMVARVSGR